jgi:hypothetical protein
LVHVQIWLKKIYIATILPRLLLDNIRTTAAKKTYIGKEQMGMGFVGVY